MELTKALGIYLFDVCGYFYSYQNKLIRLDSLKFSILIILITSAMEQHALKNINNCMNTIIYSYLETSGGQSSSLYLNVVHFFNTSVNYTSAAV
jgi:hypothetical protein